MGLRLPLLMAVLAGLALLAACGGGEESTDEVIQQVLEMLERAPGNRPDPSTAKATLIKECESIDVMRWEGQWWGRTPDGPSERPAWLVKVRGGFLPVRRHETDAPRPGTLVQIIGDRGGGGGTIRLDEREIEGPELSSEEIIERVLLELDPDPTTEGDPGLSAGTATAMTEREALEALEKEGGKPDLSMRVLTDDPAWLVEVSGEGIDSCTLAPLQGRYLSVRRADGSPVSSGFFPDPGVTPGPAVELTEEQAVERAFELLANYLFFQPDPSLVTATRTTYGEALDTMLREGPWDVESGLADDLPVWLVEVEGQNVKVGVPARYVFILNLRGGSEYEHQILQVTP